MNQLNVSDGGPQAVHTCSCALILGDQKGGFDINKDKETERESQFNKNE